MVMNIEYFEKVKKQYPFSNHKIKNCSIAFISGGIIGGIGQGFLYLYLDIMKMNLETSQTLMIMTMIGLAALITGLGIFDKIGQICGAGTFIPITGFANAVVSSAMEGRSEGPIFGIGSNMFKLAGSVITYGITSAILVALVRYWLFV
jgi:stage V sporulation protein AC